MQVDTEASRFGGANLDLKVNNLKKLRDNDVSTSPEAKIIENIHNSIVDYSAKSLIKQKASPSISNKVDIQNETIEIKKNMESHNTVEDNDKMRNDKVES
jgi:hypothetical protein